LSINSSQSNFIMVKVQYFSAQVLSINMSAELKGSEISAHFFSALVRARIQKMAKGFWILRFLEGKFVPKKSISCASKQACINQFWEELRHVARTTPPADLFEEKPTQADHELNQHEHDKCYW